MKVVYEKKKLFEFLFWKVSSTRAIVNVTFVQLRNVAIVSREDLFFEITDKEASKNMAETAFRGNDKGLNKKMSIESKTVTCKYKFS